MATSVRAAGLSVLSARVAMQLISAAAGIAITRGLGPHDKGIYVYVTVALAIVMQLTSGDSAAIGWQWGKKRLPQRAVFGASMVVSGGVTVAAMAILAAVAWHVPGQSPLWAVVAAAPFALVAQQCAGFFLTAGRVAMINAQNAVTVVAVPILAAIAIYGFHERLAAVLYIWAAGQVAAALLCALVLARDVKLFPLTTTRHVLIDHARFAMQSYGLAVVTYANARVDILVVLFVLGPAALGIYSVAIAANELLWMFTRALSVAAFGRITIGDRTQAALLTARCVRNGLLVAGLGGVGAFFAADLVPLLYGAKFAAAVGALRIVLPGAVLWSSMDILTIFFMTQVGKPLVVLLAQGVSAITCALVTLALAPNMGIYAGALGTSIGYLLGGALGIALFARATNLPLRQILVPHAEDFLAYYGLFAKVTHARLAA